MTTDNITITKDTPKEVMIQLAPPCRCKKCENGCHYGSGTLHDDDLQPLAKFLRVSVEKLKEEHLEKIEKFNTTKYRPKIRRKGDKPYGTCTFFSSWKGCSVHDAKPLQCKVATGCRSHGEEAAAWFDINHFVNKGDPESIRQYAVYLESGGKTLPGASLEELVPDKQQLKDILAFKIMKNKIENDEKGDKERNEPTKSPLDAGAVDKVRYKQ